MLRLAYANGDRFVYWWLDGYVGFNGDQKPWVRQHIGNLFVWHRKTQLKEYAQLLVQVQQRLRDQKATPAEVQADFTVLKKHAALVLEHALPGLADLALSLQPQQIAHLEKKFASNNANYRKEYLRGGVEDRQLVRYKKVMQQAEYWFGNFNAQQKMQIRAASDAWPADNELWLAERIRRQQELIRILKKIQAEKPTHEATAAMLKAYIARSFEHFTYAENRAFFDASWDGMALMVAVTINITTPAQKAHAVKRLQKLIEDCHTLGRI